MPGLRRWLSGVKAHGLIQSGLSHFHITLKLIVRERERFADVVEAVFNGIGGEITGRIEKLGVRAQQVAQRIDVLEAIETPHHGRLRSMCARCFLQIARDPCDHLASLFAWWLDDAFLLRRHLTPVHGVEGFFEQCCGVVIGSRIRRKLVQPPIAFLCRFAVALVAVLLEVVSHERRKALIGSFRCAEVHDSEDGCHHQECQG